MQTLNYSTNPNGKLFGDIWNDVRLSDRDKFFHGAELEIQYKNKPIGIAEVIVVKPFYFKAINDILAYIDIGKPAQYLAALLKKYYGANTIEPDTLLDHIILSWKKRDTTAQSELLENWWKNKSEEVTDQKETA